MWCGVGPFPKGAQRWRRAGHPSSLQTNSDCCCWRQAIYLLFGSVEPRTARGDLFFCFTFGVLRKTHTQAIEYPHIIVPLTSLLI